MARMFATALVITAMWMLSPEPAAAAQLPAETQAMLRSSDYIYTATRRKSGERSSIAPVWFFYSEGDELFFTVSPGSWKAKRLAQGSPLYIWVGEKSGPYLVGEAREVDDPALIDRMGEAYSEKYWLAWFGFARPRSERVKGGKTKAYVVKVSPGDNPG